MTWTYCERSMAWPHGERLDGLASRISCDQRCHVLTASASMAWPHKYLSPTPPPDESCSLCRPTSFRTVLTAAPHFLPVLVGGVGVVTIAPSRTSVSAVFPVYSIRVNTLSATESPRSCVAIPLIFWDRVPLSCPSFPRGIPDFRHHKTFVSVMGT